MRLLIITIVAFCFSIIKLSAQTYDLGSWNILNIKYNHNEKADPFILSGSKIKNGNG